MTTRVVRAWQVTTRGVSSDLRGAVDRRGSTVVAVGDAVMRVRARAPCAGETTRPALSAGRTVVRYARTAFGSEGPAVEINEMTMVSAAYILDQEFDA
jgi:hypothetical protein